MLWGSREAFALMYLTAASVGLAIWGQGILLRERLLEFPGLTMKYKHGLAVDGQCFRKHALSVCLLIGIYQFIVAKHETVGRLGRRILVVDILVIQVFACTEPCVCY